VADLESAVKLFAGPLGMEARERTSDPAGDHVVVVDGPWRLRLTEPSEPSWQHWLGSRPGRLHHLRFELTEPGTVPGAEPAGSGRYRVPPERNLGTRLLLDPEAPIPPSRR
jgi:catechol 2,3-dioxygenase-like lactoylglutathione lyase family enzyme